MKKILSLFVLAATLAFVAAPRVSAADDKAITISGEGVCAKCKLHETESCQNAIKAKVDGKTVTYYLTANDVSKAFHENLCHESKKVTATGTVKEVDGKKELTVTKIELAK